MWILIADASRARLFDGTKKYSSPGEFEFTEFSEANDWANPYGRAKNQDIDTDDPGRMVDRSGAGEGIGGKSKLEPREEPKDVEARQFAQQLADELDEAREGGQFGELALIAPPKFLGWLRDAISPQTQNTVSAEIDKDFSKLSLHDLKQRLPDLLES